MSEERKNDQAHVATTGDAQDSRTASPAGGGSHTPGPWRFTRIDYEPSHPDEQARDASLEVMASADGRDVLIAQTIMRDVSSEGDALATDEANARLIAAAPDLLESLREFTALYGPSTMDICAPGMRALVQRAEAAIQKASGH